MEAQIGECGAVDPYRYLSFMTRQVMKAWVERETPPDQVAWAPLQKPLNECRVALISTAAIAQRSDPSFDQQGERDNPWWGDPSWRSIPSDVTERDVRAYHLHVDSAPIESDLDVALPLRRLRELAENGIIAEANRRHLSFMGYILDTSALVGSSAPEMANALIEDAVDLALLIPV